MLHLLTTLSYIILSTSQGHEQLHEVESIYIERHSLFQQGKLLLQSYPLSVQCCQRRVNEKSIGTVIVAAVCVQYKHSGSGGVGGKACAQMNSDVNGMVKLWDLSPRSATRSGPTSL